MNLRNSRLPRAFAVYLVFSIVSFSTYAAQPTAKWQIHDFYKKWVLNPTRSDGGCAEALSGHPTFREGLYFEFRLGKNLLRSALLAPSETFTITGDTLESKTEENGVVKSTATFKLSSDDSLIYSEFESGKQRTCHYEPPRKEVVGKTVVRLNLEVDGKTLTSCTFTAENKRETCTLKGFGIEHRFYMPEEAKSESGKDLVDKQSVKSLGKTDAKITVTRQNRLLNLTTAYAVEIGHIYIDERSGRQVFSNKTSLSSNPYLEGEVTLTSNARLKYEYGNP